MFGGIISILIIIVLISSVKINLTALKENHDNKIVIKIKSLYGLIRLKKELGSFKVITKKEEKDGKIDEDLEVKMKSDSWTKYEGYTDYVNIRKKIEQAMEAIKTYKNVANYAIDKISFHTLFWKTEVGFEDAALTGLTTGMINIIKSNLFVLLNSIDNKPEKIYLKITPNFEKQVFKTDIRCIFSIKVGYIIIAGLKYLWKKLAEK